MNALTQYIELYDTHSESINAHAPALLNSHRATALEVLRHERLPHIGDESYPALSVNDMMAPDFGVNVNRVKFPADMSSAFHCGVPNISTLLGMMVNDTFVPTSSLERNLPEGVMMMSLSEAAEKHPDLVKKYLGTAAPITDAGVALNTLLLQDGVFIYIPRGRVMERPLQLVNIFNAATPLMGVRRIVVVVDDDAQAALLSCDHSQMHDVQYLANQVVEVFLGENAVFDFYDLEESSEATSRFSQLFARQQRNSHLTVNGTTLMGGTTRNNYYIDVQGDNAETRLAGMAIGSGTQIIDNYTSISHNSVGAESYQMFKYVLGETAIGSFYGRIVVDPKAYHTNAYQTNRNILASADAKMYTRPQLEIYCDEVKCSHGATVGQLDAAALFYMRQRGIPYPQARLMLMQAFMADVIDTVKIPALQGRLHQLIEYRLSGRHTLCADCAVKS